MPDTPPYSEATVELLARLVFVAPMIGGLDWDVITEEDRDRYRQVARTQLGALATAGRLLPEGAQTRAERHYSPAHDGLVERHVITTPWSAVPPEPKES